MPQPVSYNPGTPVSGSIQENSISYVVDGQQRNYRGGFGGLSWMSEVPAENNVIFIGNSTSLGRGPANIPLFYPSYNNSSANIVYAANTLPGSPRNFTTSASAYNWAVTNNFFINNSDNPIPRIDADGLTFYVDANQPSSYPQTNNDWFDLSGNGRNSTLINGPVWNSRGWIEFDGADDRSTTSFGFLSNNESHEAWIYSKGNVSSYNMFMGIILPYYGFWQGNQYIVQDFIGGAQVGYIAGSLSLNRWYHFLSTRSYNGTNTTLTTYINGTLSNQSTYSGAPSIAGGTWAIGNWDVPSAGASYPFYGDISGAKIYTKALSLAEVKQNYFQGNIVTDGLVFMTDANNLVSYPKSGTTTYNLTGSQTSGTLTNGVGYSSNNGGYWSFDGTDDYINFGNISNLGTSDFTLSVWVYIPSGTASTFRAILNKKGASGADAGYGIYYNTGMQKFLWSTANGSSASEVFTSNTFASIENTWANVVMVRQSGATNNGHYYVNGVYQSIAGAATILNVDSSVNLSLAIAGGTYTPYCFQGDIANAKIYSRALSPSEIQQNYEATKDKFQGPQIVTNGLVLNLDSANKDSYPGTGTTWTDLTGVAGNATLYNGVGFDSNLWGGSLSFDSVDDYSRITNPNVTLGTNPRTLIGWFRATSSVYGCIFGFGNSPFGTPLYGSMELWNYADPLSMHYAGGSISSGLSLSANLNKWLMAVLKFDGTTAFIQIIDNGTSYSNSANVPLNTYTANFSINKSAYASEGGGLAGYWGMSLLYNRALSASEITQNYNATKTRFGL